MEREIHVDQQVQETVYKSKIKSHEAETNIQRPRVVWDPLTVQSHRRMDGQARETKLERRERVLLGFPEKYGTDAPQRPQTSPSFLIACVHP